MNPFHMTGLAKECGFVVAPGGYGSIGVAYKRAATGTFEMCFFGQFFRKMLADKEHDNKPGYYRPNNQFHRQCFSVYAWYLPWLLPANQRTRA
ncbi:hypothetical protein [Janthinobacterium lividum]